MPFSPLRARALALLLAATAALTGCSSDNANDPTTPSATVLAAASLTDVFADIGANSNSVTATFSFGSSTTLAEQAAQGAPGDVLATADKTAMDLAITRKAVTEAPVEFAKNHLVLVVPANNPGKISAFADLAGTQWVRCADEVPCGRLALEVLDSQPAAGRIDPGRPASLEPDVRGVLAKVTSGEADAGLVYETDAVAAGDAVRKLEIPGANSHPTSYWIAPLAQGNQQAASAWIAALTSADGQRLLSEAGFALP